MLTGKKLKEFIQKETLKAVDVNATIDNWAKSVGITLFPNQLEIMEAILNPSVRNLVILASRAGGKTFTISVGIVKNSLENKGYRTILTAPKADQSLRIIADGILPLCQSNPILYNEVDWEHTSKKEFRFKNGSWVRALGAGPETNLEGHHCLSGDTKILLLDGLEKCIRDIKVGDKILCFDTDNNLVYGEVVATDFRLPNDNLYEVSYEIEGVIKSVKCTKDHKFYTKNRGIAKAQDLTDKDILIGVINQSVKEVKILSVKNLGYKEPVYNFEVKNYHNYIANNIKSKNCDMLVSDEAHAISSYVYKVRLAPMNQDSSQQKNIKIGITLYDNHFRESAHNPKWTVLRYPWDKCQNLFKSNDLTEIDGQKFPTGIIEQMPKSLKMRRWPEHPELHIESSTGMSEEDFKTQYEMEWVDSISGMLTADDQAKLFGEHDYLYKALPNETYYFGLDFAGGKLIEKGQNRDSTQLVIGRKTTNNVKEIVACYTWQGDTEEQSNQIINVITKVFPCVFGLADYSSMGISIVDKFMNANIPIAGISFKAKEPVTGKNYKNAMFDQLIFELRQDRFKYPNLNNMLHNGEMQTEEAQLINEHFFQWCALERRKMVGINDEISAPKSSSVHDDAPMACALFCWAADKADDQKRDLGVFKGNMTIPKPIFGSFISGGRSGASTKKLGFGL